jgi:hypothetical protein
VKQSQAEQSQQFIANNTELLASHMTLAWQHATAFLKDADQGSLPAGVLARLAGLLAVQDLPAFQLTLRQHAVEFSVKRGSTRYWLLNDGLSAILDATGSYWPYMTGERRAQYLRDSTLFFKELSDMDTQPA